MLHIVFDGPPGPIGPRLVETENDEGHSVAAGEWRARRDGYWTLSIETEPMPRKYYKRGGITYCAHGSSSISLADALLQEIAILEKMLQEKEQADRIDGGQFGAGA